MVEKITDTALGKYYRVQLRIRDGIVGPASIEPGSKKNHHQIRVANQTKLRCESCSCRLCLNFVCASGLSFVGYVPDVSNIDECLKHPHPKLGVLLGCWCSKKRNPFLVWFPKGCLELCPTRYDGTCPTCRKCDRTILVHDGTVTCIVNYFFHSSRPDNPLVFVCERCHDLFKVSNYYEPNSFTFKYGKSRYDHFNYSLAPPPVIAKSIVSSYGRYFGQGWDRSRDQTVRTIEKGPWNYDDKSRAPSNYVKMAMRKALSTNK